MTFSLLHSNHFCMLRKYYTGNTPFREINFPKFSPFFLTDNKIKAKSDRWRHLLAFCWSVEMLKPGCGTMKDVRRKYQNCVRKGPWWSGSKRTGWYNSERPILYGSYSFGWFPFSSPLSRRHVMIFHVNLINLSIIKAKYELGKISMS